jgi:hypothetical protein
MWEELMNPLNYWEITNQAEQHRHKMLNQAEQWRLAQEANHGGKSQPIYGPTLAQAGAILVEIGKQLQERYGQVEPLPAAPDPCPEVGR